MTDHDLKTELDNAEYEPLLPVEMKLIRWSLGIGLVSLALLALLSKLYPVG